MSVLTPALFEVLESQFGEVLVTAEGEGASIAEVDGKTQVFSPGEQYRVCCPVCKETRHRLYVSHLWYEHRHLVHCFNENCMRDPDRRREFEQRVIWNLNGAGVYTIPAMPAAVEDPTTSVPPPGLVRPLTELPESDPAVVYLRSRGYDPTYLTTEFGVGVCLRGDEPGMGNRIYVPVFSVYRNQTIMVGWQGRFVGDMNWKLTGVRKYYNRHGFHKSHYLYGSPCGYNLPFVVLMEGVSDVWRVGRAARGYLGKELSQKQRQIVVDNWGSGLVVCMGDGDAHDSNSLQAEALAAEMDTLGGRVAAVELPDGIDPGKLSYEENWDYIVRAAASVGHTITPPPKGY